MKNYKKSDIELIDRVRLARALRARHMTYTDLAYILGTSRQSLSNSLQRGRINGHSFRKICRVLCVNGAYLSGASDSLSDSLECIELIMSFTEAAKMEPQDEREKELMDSAIEGIRKAAKRCQAYIDCIQRKGNDRP